MLATDVIEAKRQAGVLAPLARPTSPAASLASGPGTELADKIAATGYAVLAIMRGARGRELILLHQSDFPDVSPAAAARLIDGSTNAIKAFWWARATAGEQGLKGLRWASRAHGPFPGPAGLAFPVAGPCGSGIVAFVGTRLSLSDQTLPDLHRECFALFATVAGEQAKASRETASLAKRELECIRLAADGLTSDEIARVLRLSLHTANQYLADAARKLNANGRMHAVAKALRLGLID